MDLKFGCGTVDLPIAQRAGIWRDSGVSPRDMLVRRWLLESFRKETGKWVAQVSNK